MIEKAPLKFVPYFKEVVWGGGKIGRYKRLARPLEGIGESWELSALPGKETVVAEGRYAGLSLSRLAREHGASLLGRRVVRRYGREFPLLVKIIDAADNLSVQVHPDDEIAASRHGMKGKTEMWYIIESEPGARIYSGFSRRLTPEEYDRMAADGSILEAVAFHSAERGDVFFLPPGRVHAIGAGNLLAEIQQASDITYRIHDYGRLGLDGRPRELHTELARDAIDFEIYDDYKKPASLFEGPDALLTDCDHFAVRRLRLDGKMTLKGAEGSFTALLCVEGEATVECADGGAEIKRGESLLLPASAEEAELSGKAILLAIYATCRAER